MQEELSPQRKGTENKGRVDGARAALVFFQPLDPVKCDSVPCLLFQLL